MLKNPKLYTNMMVEDIHRTFAFYRETLGFEHLMSVRENSEEVLSEYDPSQKLDYAVIKCGNVEMMLQARKSMCEDIPVFAADAPTGGTLTFYFEIENIEEIANRLRPRCSVVRELFTTFYGMREFYVRDPNGYILGFGQPLQTAAGGAGSS